MVICPITANGCRTTCSARAIRTTPKEQRWGRFPNPTVHIGLGQLRRVVNALIREYGAPAEIVVEMTRDFKLSPRQVAEIEKEQADNQRRNEARRADLVKLGQQVNARNLLKMRLWEELNPRDPLDRCCPYTGEKISAQSSSREEVDIDHLIPFSDELGRQRGEQDRVHALRQPRQAQADAVRGVWR